MRAHGRVVDSGVACGLAIVCVLFGVIVRADLAYFVLSIALTVPLAFRRLRPEWTAAVVLCVACVQWLTVRDTNGALPADVAVPIAVYTVAAYGTRRSSRLVMAGGLAGAVLGGISWPQLPMPVFAHVLTGAFLASAVLAAWACGCVKRLRRRQIAVEREQRAQVAVLAERSRIARDMHDVIAHSLAVMIAQADGGRYAAAASPGEATAALETIGTYGRQALAQTRQILGLLREPEPAHPGIDDVASLVEELRAGGLDVQLNIDVPQHSVEPGLGLVAYRVVQEGLTNVLKHAGPRARADVALRWTGIWLEIDVTDDGTTSVDASASGYGLVGMRERVGSYGGTVSFGPRPTGQGQQLHARIPVPA